MATLETNVFPITNLANFSCRYRLAEIAGLRPDQAEYFQNRQILTRKLSYSLAKPVLVVERDTIPYLVVPEEVTALPAEVELVRLVVHLKPSDATLELDYTQRQPDTDAIALRFLSFRLQAPLYDDQRLWQTASGRPFFPRVPARIERQIEQFVGFAVRPVVIPEGGFGLCVDVTSCYIGHRPLPVRLTRDEFDRTWKGRNCIYRFGQFWYEVRLHTLADRSVSEHRFAVDGRTWSLYEFLMEKARRPLPADLAHLPEDASVVLYLTNRETERSAPSPLCYPVFDTRSADVAGQHRRSILAPADRRNLTQQLTDQYLRGLRFGGTALQLAERPISIAPHQFPLPDLRFGHGVVLSTRRTPGTRHAPVEAFGTRRLALLKDPTAGFHSAAPLDRQYLLLPRSVHDTFGPQFVADLAATVDEFFPQPGGYAPVVVPYDDRGGRTFVNQGRRICEAAEAACRLPGYALVMVHEIGARRPRDEDQLAAMAVRELRFRCDVRAAVIHSTVGQQAYREQRAANGSVEYRCAPEHRRRLSGYLRNVALTKILLTNQRWPFVLATPLHADVTVGIDVKHNTCGLLVMGRHGGEVRSDCRRSRQKERLLSQQMSKYLADVLREEAELRGQPVSSVVVHRDGRAWPSEVQGIRRALEELRTTGHVTPDISYAVIEVPKTSPAPLRLYDVGPDGPGGKSVRNPCVGIPYYVGALEAYLCSTGSPFLRDGTAHPLHLKLVDGNFPFDQCLADFYALTTLTWTHPEGCMRHPITIKLNDRILAAEAGEYDSDALEFADEPRDAELSKEDAA